MLPPTPLSFRRVTSFAEGEAIKAGGVVPRQLQARLKEQDPSLGGLIRVMNKRQEFLWVHPRFEGEY
jgi:internalin A